MTSLRKDTVRNIPDPDTTKSQIPGNCGEPGLQATTSWQSCDDRDSCRVSAKGQPVRERSACTLAKKEGSFACGSYRLNLRRKVPARSKTPDPNSIKLPGSGAVVSALRT